MEAATRAARANITLEEQIHQIHKVKGLLPDEEKEKIGPKNVAATTAAKKVAAAAVISAKPQANPNPVVSLCCYLGRIVFEGFILPTMAKMAFVCAAHKSDRMPLPLTRWVEIKILGPDISELLVFN